MEWKITNKKVEKKKVEDYSCIIDDITNSLEELGRKYSIPKSIIHEFVTEFLIKVFKEKKSSEEEVVKKFSMPKEIVDEVKRQFNAYNSSS